MYEISRYPLVSRNLHIAPAKCDPSRMMITLWQHDSGLVQYMAASWEWHNGICGAVLRAGPAHDPNNRVLSGLCVSIQNDSAREPRRALQQWSYHMTNLCIATSTTEGLKYQTITSIDNNAVRENSQYMDHMKSEHFSFVLIQAGA